MIDTLLIDVDGVLTNGKQYVDHHGKKMFKAFHSRDIAAIRELVSVEGVRVILISADDWPGGPKWAQKVGAEFLHLRDKTKLDVEWEYCAGVGDDVWDVKFLHKCGQRFCPADAHESVKRECVTLQINGGQGVIAELVYRGYLQLTQTA